MLLKRALFLPLAALASALFAQAAEEVANDKQVQLVQPQVVIAVEHVPGTGDVVQLHYKGGTYDEPAIQAAVKALAEATGATPESYQFMPGATPEELTRVVFVTKNLLDPSGGDIRLHRSEQNLIRRCRRRQRRRNIRRSAD